jgi:hypothetical protein
MKLTWRNIVARILKNEIDNINMHETFYVHGIKYFSLVQQLIYIFYFAKVMDYGVAQNGAYILFCGD